MDAETIDYRLDNIEKTLNELKNVVIATRLQQKDIDDLIAKQSEILNAINSHDKRIRDLEILPTKHAANRWQYITDYIFKALVAAAVAAMFVILGVK